MIPVDSLHIHINVHIHIHIHMPSKLANDAQSAKTITYAL